MIGAIWTKKGCKELVERLWQVSPVVERVAEDRAFVSLGRQVSDSQIDKIYKLFDGGVMVGVASSPFCAYLASWRGVVVPAGEEASFAADFALEVLPVEKETIRRLKLLGFERLGELQELAIGDLVTQFGEEGQLIWERCRGIEERPLAAERLPDRLAAEMALDSDNWLVRLGGEVVAPLFERLRGRRELCGQLVASFDEGSVVEVNFSRATDSWEKGYKQLVERLQSVVWQGEPSSVEIVLTRTIAARHRQLSLFEKGERRALVEAFASKRGEALMAIVWDEPCARLRERRAHLQSLVRDACVQPTCVPRLLRQRPMAFGESWEVEEDWWTEKPIARRYALARLASGALVRVFEDRYTGSWYRQ